jgi:hypothetical protein
LEPILSAQGPGGVLTVGELRCVCPVSLLLTIPYNQTLCYLSIWVLTQLNEYKKSSFRRENKNKTSQILVLFLCRGGEI